MRNKKCLFLILLLMLIPAIVGLYSNQPRIRSENGHLFIESATNHNISLNTKGQGYINVNNENLLQVVGLAKEAWDAVESFRTNDLATFADTIKNVALMIDGPRSLSNRVTALETQMLNGTSMAVPNKGKAGATPNVGRLGIKLANLEKKVANLVSLLSISECLSNPCQNGGTCMDMYNGFQCYCPRNWQGRLCEVDVDECMRFVHTDLGCQNGADCRNTPGSYECLCAPNWFGLHCTKKKNDCNSAQSSELCGYGVCINQGSTTGFTCICNQGWTTDGTSNPACTVDVDECKANKHTCSVNPPVECRNTRGSFTCGNCPIGYEGDGFLCTDINECLVNNGGCSTNPRVHCINNRGSFACESCPPGYNGDGFNCVRALGGLCANDNGGCHPFAECTVYAERTIQCTCPRGFAGSGYGPGGCVPTETDLEPCSDNPCGLHGLCLNTGNNSFICNCNPQYTGRTCNVRLEDPCLINPCHDGKCIPGTEPGEFTCSCSAGYFGHLCESELEPCGGYFDTPNGTLRYPESNTTLTYQSNMNCAWIIEVTPGYVLNISFIWIDVEKTFGCTFDSVEIMNSEDNDGKILGKFCGKTIPTNNSIISDSNIVSIRFRSDKSKNYRGFQLNYTMIKPSCGGIINIDSHGTLSSPGSPGKYPANRDCFWTLNTRPGNRIQFNFYLLQFERHPNCSYDYLEIRDSPIQHSPVLTRLCNNTLPPPILTSGSHALLHFHSDSSGQDYGFQLMYSVTAGIPGCGGIYTSPSGVISSPVDLTSDSNHYLDNLNCEWHIKLPLNQKIKLTFVKKFAIEASKNNCSADYLEIHDGPSIKSPLISRYCGTTRIDQPILTSSNEVTIYFKSDFSTTAEGFTIKYDTVCGGIFTDSNGIIESPFYPNPYPQNKICTYLIAQPVGKAIQLSFLDMDIEDLSFPNCFYDSLQIRDGDSENSTRIALLCGSIEKIPKLPYISTHNYMWLQFSTDHSNNNKGFRANYSTIDTTCGGILKDPSGIIQSSKNSEQYLHNQTCKWIISVNETSQIRLTWLTFSLEDQHNCNNDFIEIYDNSISGNASRIARYCGSKVPPVLTSLGNRLTIIFKTDHSIARDGFMLSYTALSKTQACGGNFFTSEGFIKSPNYPNNYPSSRDCTWVINVPVTYQIELNISQFSLELSSECRYDYLEIRNGGYPTSPLIGKYCGSKILRIISSMSNSLFVRFVTDGTRENKGFYIQWYTITKGCGGTLNTDMGHIISPNYPLPVQETIECFYKIVVPQGNQIILTIVDIELKMDLFPGMMCKDDFLEFYDGSNSASKSLGIYCSDLHSSTLVHSSSNQMYIKFRSSGYSKGRGFSLSYNTDCNVTIKGYQGAIELPKVENMRKDKCSWTIITPKRSRVNITFTSLKLFHSHFMRFMAPHYSGSKLFKNQCTKSQLNISEGVNINEINTVLWRANCTTEPVPIISSTKNIVRLDFGFTPKSSFLDKIDSFRLEWIVDSCGGILQKKQGEFTSPGYPGFYPSNTGCEWNIVSNYGFTIEITIEDSWFDTSSSCSSDYLAVYNGNDDTGLEILRICQRQTNPITITSGGNEAFVRFESDTEFQRKGFRATYRTVLSKCGGRFTAPQGVFYSMNYPQNYDANSSCIWNIEIAETHLINLTFVDFNTRNIPLTKKDLVQVYDGDIQGKLLLNHSGNSVPPPIISSSNKLLVLFEVGNRELRAKGFKAIYSTACGAKIITNESGIIASNPFVANNNCTWTIISDSPQSKVTLTFSHIDIVHLETYNIKKENSTDVVCSQKLFHTIFRVLDGPDADAPELIKFCKSYPVPPPIVSNGPAMRIEFTDNSGGLDAFVAVYSVRSTACGGSYDMTKGTISSPGYPNNYLSDSECVYILNSSAGNRVSLTFITFELVENDFCNEDYVEIRESNSSGPAIGTYCGSKLPSQSISGSSLWVKFRSSSNSSAKGFTANFEYVNQMYFTQQSGVISNPSYPRTYRGSDSFYWSISVSQRQRVQVVIKEFLSTSPNHHLKIYDGMTVEALLLLDLNDNNYINALNQTITSNNNIMLIVLEASNSHVGGIQFLISWTEVDIPYTNVQFIDNDTSFNSTTYNYYLSPRTNYSVIITSPNYPHGSASNLNITWTIHADPQYHIEIEFLYLDLFSVDSFQERFSYDYINVETVDPDTGNTISLKSLYKNRKNNVDTVIVGKNKVMINFFTSPSFSGHGFKAEAKLKCGGQLRGPSGLIDLSNITETSFMSNLCVWNVTVRPGRIISVKFISMQFLLDNTCRESYVLIKNGFYEDSPVIGQYCNNSNVSTIYTTGNKLQVQIKFFPPEVIKIEFEENSINCGGQIDLNDVYNITQITSPSYPNIPPPHVECIWRVVAPSGERISVNIEDLNLSSDYECEQEYLEFRDGAAQFSRVISHICRSRDIEDIETKENFLFIKYFTDLNVPSNGFKLNISIAKCGGTRRALRGTIFSPNYPGSYESNMDCEYRIITSTNRRIELHFDTLSLKKRYPQLGITDDSNPLYNETYDDSLTIYDVDPINQTRIEITKIFGSHIPTKAIKSFSWELVIKFKSHNRNGPFYSKNEPTKFSIKYWTDYYDCDKIYDAESGEITNPALNHMNIERIYCIYTIKVPKGRRLTFEVIEGRSIVQSCSSYTQVGVLSGEHLLVFQGNINFGQVVCIDPVINSPSTNYIFESSMNEAIMNYEFIRGNPVGFRIKYTSDKLSICADLNDTSIKGSFEVSTEKISSVYCQWDLVNNNGTIVIKANIKVNESKITSIFNSLISISSGDEILKTYSQKISNKNDKFTILSPLPTTKLMVKGNKNSINFTARFDYFINSCGGVINGQKIEITSPNYPKNYRQNTNCAWLINLPEGENVNIRFSEIDLESSCDSNYVKLHDGPSPESPVLGKYCGNNLPENLVATSNQIWIEFSTDSPNQNKKGFNLTLESTRLGCGMLYTSESGQFSSKNFPSLYPNNDDCEWTIAVWPGNRINLQFVDRFSLEQSVNCTKDYVQVFDYRNNEWVLIGNRFCGRQMPPVFRSSETKLKVRFRTDNDVQGDGFKANWKSFCGGIFTESSGKIVSPNYPNKYLNNLRCNYTILIPGKPIQLTFRSFELEDSRCRYDNLTVYSHVTNDEDETNHFIGSYCGKNIPNTLTIKHGVTMIFMTDTSVSYKGFEILYELPVCGGQISAPGIIKSPTSTLNVGKYPNDANCTWIIRAPPNQVVWLVFTEFQMESSYAMSSEDNCPNDAVIAIDESDIGSNNSRPLGVFCGNLNDKLPKIVSRTNTLYMQFLTDGSVSDKGFVAEVSFSYGEASGCGGTIRLNKSNAASGYILKSPKVPVKSILDCGWLILVEPSYVIQIQMINYTETPKCPGNTTDCRCSSIKFLDGPGRMAFEIYQYCLGNVGTPSIVSSGNEAFIRYLTFNVDVDVDFEMKITPIISICGPKSLTATNETQILTSPNYPLPYDNNLLCSWTIELGDFGSVTMLNFTDLDLADNKDCKSDYLEVQYEQWMTTQSIQLCHNDHMLNIKSDRSVKLKLHTDGQKTSKGFRLEYKSAYCLPLYDKRNGRVSIYSGRLQNQECTFSIILSQPNLTISAYFSNAIPMFNHDLTVYDGPNVSSPLLYSFSDENNYPPPAFSTGPSLTIRCRDRRLFWRASLDLSYTSSDQGRGCGGRIFNVEGKVTSPMYPSLYRKDATCRWDIAVPRPHPIRISFGVFDLGTRSSCDTNYLELYDLNHGTGIMSLVGKYCGGDNPADHMSPTGSVVIRYVTTIHNSGSGWTISFRSKQYYDINSFSILNYN